MLIGRQHSQGRVQSLLADSVSVMAEWQGFYSAEQVSRLAHVPRGTLHQWKVRGIVAPSVSVVQSEQVVAEGYSFADLAIIKLLRALRTRQLSLKSVVNALRHLYERFGPPNCLGWENAHVYVLGKEVFARRPDDWDTTLATRAGQRAEVRVLGELAEEEGAVIIPREFGDVVEINLAVMEGQPVVRDTRVPTAVLASLFDQGLSINLLAHLYAPIPRVAIQRAIAFERSLDEAQRRTAAETRSTTA